jgi:hypothetical protein
VVSSASCVCFIRKSMAMVEKLERECEKRIWHDQLACLCFSRDITRWVLSLEKYDQWSCFNLLFTVGKQVVVVSVAHALKHLRA